jgi:two-component system, LytTR family, response regulator AlgR
VNVLIVDDEPPARTRLKQLLAELGEHTVVGEAQNGEEALQLVTRVTPDVVLLDISMPGISGLETAHHLNALDKPPSVIFTTAYDEYAVAAFDARAIGYVLKPVRRERLQRALEHAARVKPAALERIAASSGLAERRNHVCTRVRGELKLIPIQDIQYFHADQKYVRVHHRNGQDLLDESLKMLEDEFAMEFVRIHRRALVAVQKIEALRQTADGRVEVVLRSGSGNPGRRRDDPLIVSRRHLPEVRRRIKAG